MIISSCPRCGDAYRVPKSVLADNSTDHALVQCPWCASQFDITEVVRRLPPELILLEPSKLEPIASEESHAEFFGIGLSGSNHEVGLDPADTNLADPNVHLTLQDYSATEAISQNDSWQISRETNEASLDFPKPREKVKRKSSGLGSFIGIIVGGLASLPLAGLILLALGKAPNLGFWPFNGHSEDQTHRSAAPLPPRDNSERLQGTPLRFNQLTDPQKNNTDSRDVVLQAILADDEPQNDTTEEQKAVTEESTQKEASETPLTTQPTDDNVGDTKSADNSTTDN